MGFIDPAKLAYVSKRVGYRSPHRFEFRAGFLFEGIDVHGLRVLDIGCGPGTFALWAGLNGAAFALGLEPEAAGSTAGTLGTFRQLISELNLGATVSASSAYLQQLEAYRPFDLVVMYNVINHLNEGAVAKLHEDQGARSIYRDLLRILRTHVTPSATIIVADSSRENICARLGLETRFTRGMEWDKHQSPEVWIDLFREAGYQLLDLRWSPFYPLGGVRSRVLQFLTTSHFVLRFKA